MVAGKRRNVLLAFCVLAVVGALFIVGCESSQGSSTASSESLESSASSASSESASSEGAASADAGHDMTPTSMPVVAAGQRSWVLELEKNPSAEALEQLMNAGLSLDMTELNGNEKYVYLDEPLPSDPVAVGRIEAGDVMLYGDNCLVVFYQSFDTEYSYTRLGHIWEPDGLADELGEGDVHVKLYLEWSE